MTAVDRELAAVDLVTSSMSPIGRRRWAWLGNAWVIRAASVAAVLLAWQLIGSNYPYATSSPGAVVQALGEDFGSLIVPGLRETLRTFAIGFTICIVGGVAIGLAMARVRVLQVVLEPYVQVLYSSPFIAFFPVLILVFGVSTDLRVSVVVLSGTMPIVLSTYLGAREVGANLLDVGAAFAARPLQVLRTVVIPGSVPYIFAGIRVGFMQAMVGAVVIEIATSTVGVGNVLRQSALTLQLGRYFAMVIVLGLFNLAFTSVLRAVEHSFTTPMMRREARAKMSAITGRARRAVTRPPTAAEAAPGRRGLSTWVGSVAARLQRVRARRLGAPYRPSAIRRALDRSVATRTGRIVMPTLSLVVLLLAWEQYADGISRAVLPQPSEIWHAFFELVVTGREIWSPLWASLHVLATGFVIAVAVGIPVGILMGRFRLFENLLDPYVAFVYALPTSVFVPLMVVWFGFGFQFRVVYVVVSGVFPVIINTMTGVRNVSPELLSTGRSFCASERQILRTIVLPAITPFVLAGVRLGFSMCWVGVVVSEVLTSQVGLGGRINYFGDFFMTAHMWVPIIFIMVIAVAILKLMNWVQPKLAPWADSARPTE